MGAFIDLTGQRFGKLIVTRRAANNKNNKTCWYCDCDCGNKDEIKVGQDLKRQHTTSCGHCNEKRINGTTIIDIRGKQYGNFIVKELMPERTSNRQTLWKCKCLKCQTEVIVREGDLVHNNGNYIKCDCSKKYIGEETIKNILKEHDISFEYQKTFQNCKFINTNRPAVFDFYVDNKYIIEYDGQQHFEYRENGISWNNKEHFEKTQLRDKFKNKWCLDNNIPLIRIPYTHLKELCLEDLLLETSTYIFKGEGINE